MKKILAVVICVLLTALGIMSFSACGDDKEGGIDQAACDRCMGYCNDAYDDCLAICDAYCVQCDSNFENCTEECGSVCEGEDDSEDGDDA